jgi:hypothetical protein
MKLVSHFSFHRLFLLSLISSSIAVQSCSSSETTDDKIAEIKEYILFVEGGDIAVTQEFRRLIADFNARACIQALTITDDAAEANSTIKLANIEGTEKDKIGYGQWRVRTVYGEGLSDNYNMETYATKYYSMELEFDEKYFRTRMASEKPEYREDLQVLTFHEIGHGFQEPHAEDKTDLMYYTVDGKKNLSYNAPFFNRVRGFFNAREITGCQ